MQTDEEVVQQDGAGEDFFDTPALEVPKTPPDAHRATVTSVTSKTLNNDKQTAVLSVNLRSIDLPTLETSLDIFIPKGFEENIGNPAFNPSELPEEEGNKQQTSFRMGIANSEKTATLQRLYAIARKAGRDPVELGLKRKPTGLAEYTENYNLLLQGLEVIMLRRERGGDDPAFSHQLQVRDVVASDEYEQNPKRFKRYQLAWESV